MSIVTVMFESPNWHSVNDAVAIALPSLLKDHHLVDAGKVEQKGQYYDPSFTQTIRIETKP